MIHFQTHGTENIMSITLELNLSGETVSGGLAFDYQDTITTSSEQTGEESTMTVGLPAGEEVEIEIDNLDVEITAAHLEGTPDKRIEFAYEMLEGAVSTITRQLDRANEAQASAVQHMREMGQRLDEAKAERRAAQNKLDAVWPAVLEVIDHGFDPANAGPAILNRLRGLGLEPKPEVEHDLDTVG